MNAADARPGGVCLWLTGESGAGKSTVARALVPQLEARGHTVSVLDVVPLLAKQPCEPTSEGKLLRKAFVAAEIAKHGGIAICVTVSSRREVRQAARDLVGADRFVEVLVEVPSSVAAARRAARGRRVPLRRRLRGYVRRLRSRLRGSPTPGDRRSTAPDVTIDAVAQTPEEGADALVEVLLERGFLLPATGVEPPRPERLEAAGA